MAHQSRESIGPIDARWHCIGLLVRSLGSVGDYICTVSERWALVSMKEMRQEMRKKMQTKEDHIKQKKNLRIRYGGVDEEEYRKYAKEK